MVAALQTRGLHFETMYSLYGREDNARVRFVVYIGRQSYADKLADRIFDSKKVVLVIGDGYLKGPAKKVVMRLKQRGDVRMFDEYYTLGLDSRSIMNHARLFSPPGKIVEKVFDDGTVKRSLYRAHGLKQCNALTAHTFGIETRTLSSIYCRTSLICVLKVEFTRDFAAGGLNWLNHALSTRLPQEDSTSSPW